jgi:monoamine oxidase
VQSQEHIGGIAMKNSPVVRALREAKAASRESKITGIPIDEVTGIRAERSRAIQADSAEALALYNAAAQRVAERGTPEDHLLADDAMSRFRAASRGVRRRDFLKGAGAIAGAGALAALGGGVDTRSAGRASAATSPNIVIVGAGIAGLTCAYTLWKGHSIKSTIYEMGPSTLVGGRIHTLRGFWQNTQKAEAHAEFVTKTHTHLLALVKKFGLGLDKLNDFPSGVVGTYWVNGHRLTQAQINTQWKSTYTTIFSKAAKAAPWPQTYKGYSATGYKFDHMSTEQWVSSNIGLSTDFGQVCLQYTMTTSSATPATASALNLIFLGGATDGAPTMNTELPYHIHGGNDGVITKLVAALPSGTIHYTEQLVAIVKNSNGSYTCSFQNGSTVTQVPADGLVLALPCTTLRNVTLSKAGFSTLMMTAIKNMGLGTAAKIFMQTTGRPWNKDGYDGSSMATLYGGSWESNWQTNNFTSPTAIFVTVPGGSGMGGTGPTCAWIPSTWGLTSHSGAAPAAMVTYYLTKVSTVFPGVRTAYISGSMRYEAGTLDPRFLGSWEYYKVGGFTTFSGYQATKQGYCFMAGSWTTYNFYGYMEGGVRTGQHAATQVNKAFSHLP